VKGTIGLEPHEQLSKQYRVARKYMFRLMPFTLYRSGYRASKRHWQNRHR